MRFTTPLAFLLLLSLPYIVWLARPRPGAMHPWRDWAVLALRLLILGLLVLSLAGAQTVHAADELAVVFLIDGSDSISPQQAEQAEGFVREAMATMGPDDQAAVIVFGADALVERPMSGLAELAPINSVPQPLHTDLAEAIRLGLALFPAGSARRLVLLSDGSATLGDSHEAAQLAAASGVEIDYVPLTRPGGEAEALLTAVDAPTRVNQGETFRIQVTAESTADMSATLRVLAGSNVVYEETVRLRPGANHYQIALQATEQEFARYRVQLAPAADHYYQNNELAAFTEILGPPRVLLVAADGTVDDNGNPVPDESPALRQALEAAGLQVERATPGTLPAGLAELSNYASIILVNVNAKNLSPRKMASLQTYVRDLGGGLVVVGGPESYGMGGYFRTPLEETLPVEMQIKDQDRFPSVSIVLVIDRSGSMGMQEGGLTKIQLANEGAVRVVELLNDVDEITVMPVDTQPSNVVGPVSAVDKQLVIDQIRQIGAGGGGINVRTGLEAAAEVLLGSANQVRHIIVLADGADSNEKEGVPELIESLVAEGITVSMVAIGDGPDVPWLQDMAALGGGRFHFTDRAANLPQIFTQETTSIQRSYLVEERFFPSAGPDYTLPNGRLNPLMGRITQVPPLYGYVGTSPRATAQVILETHQGDPLLAAWQYGLGRAVAWTSDASGRWARDWVPWSAFPVFWSGAVRWTIAQGRDHNVETVVQFDDQTARLTVDARDGTQYLNELTMEANVVSPSGETETIQLTQVAPGRYEASFSPTEEGAYFIRVAGRDNESGAGDEMVIGQTSGWVLGYSPEYRQFEANPQLLAEIAEHTGGEQLAEAATAFSHDLPSQPTARPIWPWLTLLATVLLPVDIGVRRLVITRRDWQRAWAAIFGRWRTAAPVAERSPQVSRLFQAKQRAGTARGEAESPVGAEPEPVRRQDASRATETQVESSSRETGNDMTGGREPVRRGSETSHGAPESDGGAPESDGGAPESDGGALAARLLARKRRQERDKNSK